MKTIKYHKYNKINTIFKIAAHNIIIKKHKHNKKKIISQLLLTILAYQKIKQFRRMKFNNQKEV